MELVVTEVERGVDGLEGLEVDVDLLLLALVRDDGAAVDDQTVGGDLGRGGRRCRKMTMTVTVTVTVTVTKSDDSSDDDVTESDVYLGVELQSVLY